MPQSQVAWTGSHSFGLRAVSSLLWEQINNWAECSKWESVQHLSSPPAFLPQQHRYSQWVWSLSQNCKERPKVHILARIWAKDLKKDKTSWSKMQSRPLGACILSRKGCTLSALVRQKLLGGNQRLSLVTLQLTGWNTFLVQPVSTVFCRLT